MFSLVNTISSSEYVDEIGSIEYQGHQLIIRLLLDKCTPFGKFHTNGISSQ